MTGSASKLMMQHDELKNGNFVVLPGAFVEVESFSIGSDRAQKVQKYRGLHEKDTLSYLGAQG